MNIGTSDEEVCVEALNVGFGFLVVHVFHFGSFVILGSSAFGPIICFFVQIQNGLLCFFLYAFLLRLHSSFAFSRKDMAFMEHSFGVFCSHFVSGPLLPDFLDQVVRAVEEHQEQECEDAERRPLAVGGHLYSDVGPEEDHHEDAG